MASKSSMLYHVERIFNIKLFNIKLLIPPGPPAPRPPGPPPPPPPDRRCKASSGRIPNIPKNICPIKSASKGDWDSPYTQSASKEVCVENVQTMWGWGTRFSGWWYCQCSCQCSGYSRSTCCHEHSLDCGGGALIGSKSSCIIIIYRAILDTSSCSARVYNSNAYLTSSISILDSCIDI